MRLRMILNYKALFREYKNTTQLQTYYQKKRKTKLNVKKNK